MQSPLLPLFPLNVVLFPRTVLPLHIFEERYKLMIGEAVDRGTEFGIVLAKDNGVLNIGCTATVERIVERYEDGRMDILIGGRRRFELLAINDEMPYLRGEVSYFEDELEGDPPPEMKTRAMSGFGVLRRVSEVQIPIEPQPDDPQLSFLVAQAVPDLDFRQTLLATRSETERLKRFNDYVPVFLVRQKHTAHVRSLAPKNGHVKPAQ